MNFHRCSSFLVAPCTMQNQSDFCISEAEWRLLPVYESGVGFRQPQRKMSRSEKLDSLALLVLLQVGLGVYNALHNVYDQLQLIVKAFNYKLQLKLIVKISRIYLKYKSEEMSEPLKFIRTQLSCKCLIFVTHF